MPVESTDLFDQPPEIQIKFRRTAGKIHRGNIGLGKRGNAQLCGFSRHDLGAVGPRIDMAVATGLVTEFADIDLEDRNAGRMQGR